MLACHGFFLLVTISLTLNAAEAGYLTYFENNGFVIKIAHDPDSSEEDAELETTTEKDQNENKGSTLADHKPVEESPSAHTNAAAPEPEEKEETHSAGESQEPTPEPEKEEETPSPTPEPEEEETPPAAPHPEEEEEEEEAEEEEEESPSVAPHPEEEEESPSVAPHPEEEEEESPSVAKSTDGDSADTSQSTTPARPKKPRTRPWTGATYWGPNGFTVTPDNQHMDTNRRGEQVCIQHYEMKFEDSLSTYYSGVSVNCFPEGLEPIGWRKGDEFSVCGVVYYDKDNTAWKIYTGDGRQTCEGSKKVYGRRAFETYVLYYEECDEIKRKIMCDDIDEEEPTEESKDPPENPMLRPYTGRSYSSPNGLTVSPGKRQMTTTRKGEEVCEQVYDMQFKDFVNTYHSEVTVSCFPEGQEPKDITNKDGYTVCGVVHYDKDKVAWTTRTEDGVTECVGKQKIYGRTQFAYAFVKGEKPECEEMMKKIRCANNVIGAQ